MITTRPIETAKSLWVNITHKTWGEESWLRSLPRSTAVGLLFFVVIFASQFDKFDKLYESSQHDLRAYIACSHNIRAERNIYTTHHQEIPEDTTLTRDVPQYFYPPLLGMLFMPATAVASYDTIKHIWFFLNFLFLLHSILLAVSILPFGSHRAAAFFTISGIMVGSNVFSWLLRTAQIDGLVIYLSLLSLYAFYRKKWILSAVIICIATWIKLTPLIFQVCLAVRGNRRYLIAAISGMLGLALVQYAAAPTDFGYFFTDSLFKDGPSKMPIPVMQSLWSLFQLLFVPSRRYQVFEYPDMFEQLLMGAKIVAAILTTVVLVRKRDDRTGLFYAFAVCSSFSLLITDISWIMRFVWNLVTVSAIGYGILNSSKGVVGWLVIQVGAILILLNMEPILITLFSTSPILKTVLKAGPSLHALGALILLTALSIRNSRWIAPIEFAGSQAGKLVRRTRMAKNP